MKSIIIISAALAATLMIVSPITCAQESNGQSSITNTTKRLITYSGSLLPSDWSLVTLQDDRALIGFKNGSARNALLEELEPKDRTFLQRLQNGTLHTNTLTQAKEKLAQWTSTVTTTVGKLSKSAKEQFDSLFNNDKNKSDLPASLNTTILT